jgi:hypothetical protein
MAAAAGAVFGFWAALMILAVGDAGVQLSGFQQGQFVPLYFLMIYGPPIIIAVLSYFSLRRTRQS